MTSVIIVDKSGNAKSTQVSSASDLYKKCGFKSDTGFELAHTWTLTFNDTKYMLDVYGKTKGKAGSENKFEFPPPIDNVLFFGSCAVIGREESNDGNKYISLSVNEFNDIIEHLQGGYSDLDSEETEESDTTPTNMTKTKQGYVKDGFIASDDESIEEEVIKKVKPAKIVTKKPVKPKPKKKEEPVIAVYVEELTEDAYL